MVDAVEVAIESALLDRIIAFTTSPDVMLALPNVKFTPPQVTPNAYYLRANFLPATTLNLGIAYNSTNQHYGIFQVDVFYNKDRGELAPARIASQIIQWFVRGSIFEKDNKFVQILRTPYRGPSIKDDPWIMIPVSIPYMAFSN